jgi:hypothetical protein
MDLPKIRYARHHEDKVVVNGRQSGVSLDCGYLANERAMVSFAALQGEYAETGTEVTVAWGEQPVSAKPAVEEHRQVETRATVAPVSFVDFARENYRSRWSLRSRPPGGPVPGAAIVVRRRTSRLPGSTDRPPGPRTPARARRARTGG